MLAGAITLAILALALLAFGYAEPITGLAVAYHMASVACGIVALVLFGAMTLNRVLAANPYIGN
jgi:hypothetical protein